MNKWGVQMLFEAMQMVSSTRATSHVTSAILGMFWEKIWPVPEKSIHVPKIAKIEGYNTRFVLSWSPSSERHAMTPRGMGGHRKGVMWLGTNMWMHLCSFQAVLGFKRNEHMECLKAFWANTNDAKHLRNVTIYIGFPWNISGENRGRPGEVQKCPKNSQN